MFPIQINEIMDYAGNKSHVSLSQKPLVGHKVRPAIAKDSPKRPGTNGIKSLSQIPGRMLNLKHELIWSKTKTSLAFG